MGYKNFATAIYFTIRDLTKITDLEMLKLVWEQFERYVSCNKVYLETYRGQSILTSEAEREKLLSFKLFFESKGIKVAAGITPIQLSEDIFVSFCYTNQQQKTELQEIVKETAEIFEEIILDDFYFTNCCCESCIAAKGSQNWSEFRIHLLQQFSEEILIKTAKMINPKNRLIIKFPNWYEDYQATGYDLEQVAASFDLIYTGTETRNAPYTQQNLQRYLSYFLMRYLENVKPGKNAGGWFDTFDCHYNLGAYAEQAYLTLFAKAKEVTLFCAGLLLTSGKIFLPLIGYVFETVDAFLEKLGEPIGIACYKPYHSTGEKYLHGYLGMIGLPLEPVSEFPTSAELLLLTASAAHDQQLVAKLKEHLLKGKKVIITSGLLRELAKRGLSELVEVAYSTQKAAIQLFASSMYECSYSNYFHAAKEILIPQIEYATNDTWQLISGISENQNFPILLSSNYGKGKIYLLTIPENFEDLAYFPPTVLNKLREISADGLGVWLEGESQVSLFLYDNRSLIVESFLPYNTEVKLVIKEIKVKLVDLIEGEEFFGVIENGVTRFKLILKPGSYQVFQYQSM